jgi:cytoskeletal protein RodZ
MSIGAILKRAREDKNLSVADVAAATRIRWKFIQALEDENFRLIPSQVFAKGFLKTYSNFLELDTASLLNELTNYYSGSDKVKKAEPSRKPAASLYGLNPMYIAYLAIFLLLALLMIFELRSGAGKAKVAEAPEVKTEIVTKEVEPVKKIIPAPIKTGVKIEAVTRSWVSVESDGAAAYSGVIDAGHWINFRGRSVKVRAGNGAGVRVYINGEDQGLMGAANEVVERTYNQYK